MMPTRKGFLQGYNAQIAVTGDQLIVAIQVGQSTNNQACFLPMMPATQDVAARIHAATGNSAPVIGTVSADAGYMPHSAGKPADGYAVARSAPAVKIHVTHNPGLERATVE